MRSYTDVLHATILSTREEEKKSDDSIFFFVAAVSLPIIDEKRKAKKRTMNDANMSRGIPSRNGSLTWKAKRNRSFI